jgi:hypothetical protein
MLRSFKDVRLAQEASLPKDSLSAFPVENH